MLKCPQAIVLADTQMDANARQHFFAEHWLLSRSHTPPIFNPFTLFLTSFKADRKIIGIPAVEGSDFSFAQVSNPLSPGIITSSRIKSGRSA